MTRRLSPTNLIQSRAFRRALLFVVGIGAPALAAIWLRESNGLLLGVITALMFGFADDEGTLARRLTALGRSAAGMAIGGAVGHLLGGYGPMFWLLFVGAAFGAAWLNRSGKTAHIGARLAVMALAITAGSPELTRTEVLFVVGALALAVLARLADHAVFGPLPPSSIPPPPRAAPESDILWLRYAAAYAAAATVGLWLGLMIDPRHAIWVAVTTLVVMQPDDRGNYRRIVERVLGTALGVVVAYVLTRYVLTNPLTVAALLVTAAVMPHHIPIRYWLHTAAIALLVLLAYDLASHASVFTATPDPALFSERLIDVFVGSLLALLGTIAAFPWSELRPQQASEPG